MRTSRGPTLAATRKASTTLWKESHDDQVRNSQSEFSIEGHQNFLSLFRSSLWLWGSAGFFMIVATNTVTSDWAWAERVSAPPDPAAVITGDQELIKEELEFIQEETVSIAVRRAQPISEAASEVYVITGEDIRHSGATDLPTVLRRIPGLEVMQMTAADFNVSVRGDNQPSSNKLLVLVDGRSIYLDSEGGVFWKAIPITLPEIKQIEVLKGPASAIYGFNAFDGVINIITKTPDEIKGTLLQVGGGEFDTLMASAIHGGRYKNLGYRFSYGYDQTNQWQDRDEQAFRSNKFNLHTQYALSDMSQVFLEGGLVDVSKFEGKYEEAAAPSLEFTDSYVRVGYEQPDFFLRGWWRRQPFETDTAINPSLATFGPGGTNGIFVTGRDGKHTHDATFTTYDLETQHSVPLGAHNLLTYGANYRLIHSTSNYLSKTVNENRFGFFLQDEWTLHPDLHLIPGFRYDLDTFIDPTFSPRVSLIYQLGKDHTLRTTFAQAYRPPNTFQTHIEAFSTTTLFGGAVTQVTPIQGNDNLKPEKISSYSIEYQGWFFKHRLRLRTALFYNRLKNLINSRDISGVVIFENNSGRADIYGGEAGFEALMTPWLTGFANYAYQQYGKNFSGTARRAGPRFKTNAGMRMDLDNGLNSEVALHYVSAVTYPINSAFSNFAQPPFNIPPPNTHVGNYVLLNIRGGYRFWNDKAELAISAFNALNDKHREHPLGDIIRSRVMGWLTLKWDNPLFH
jgi:iron complex outermembrane receptor protein